MTRVLDLHRQGGLQEGGLMGDARNGPHSDRGDE